MPTLNYPRSDLDRLALLERIQQTATARLANGDAIIEQAVLDDIGAFVAEFKPLVQNVQVALSGRIAEVEERRQAADRLNIFVRDFFSVLKRRMRRDGEPAALWRLYGLGTDGTLPNPKNNDALLQWGDRIVEGDALAVAAGHPAMLNPTAAEVQAVLETARAEMADVPAADEAYDQAQEAVAARRGRADELLRFANALLDYKLFGQDAPSVRRIKRNFGFNYDYLEGEPRDLNDPEAPPDQE